MGIVSDLLGGGKPKAKRATVEFAPGVVVSGYRLLKTDEFRVGATGLALVLGYEDAWLRTILWRVKNGSNLPEALTQYGFSGVTQEVSIVNIGDVRGGAGRVAQTLDLADMNCLIGYAMIQGKKQAIALDMGLRRVALEVFFRSAFGVQIDQSVIRPFYKEYAKGLCWADEDHRDVRDSFLPGDTTSFSSNTLDDYFCR